MPTPIERRPACEATLGDVGEGCDPGQRVGGAWTLCGRGLHSVWAGPELFWKNSRGNLARTWRLSFPRL